jgi:hypothetical protein
MSQLGSDPTETRTQAEQILGIIFEVLERALLCLALILAGAYLREHRFRRERLHLDFNEGASILLTISTGRPRANTSRWSLNG